MMGQRNATFLGYVRPNGDVGVRDCLLVLPSVVCATRAAAWAVEETPDAVTVEHPVGCAQIGADREQTLRTLVGVGSHPNVRKAVVLGLGCEGVQASEVGSGIRELKRHAEVVTIQSSGGTREAAQAARTLLHDDDAGTRRELVSVERLILGVGPIEDLGDVWRSIIDEFLERGGRVIQMGGQGRPLPYAMRAGTDAPHFIMEGTYGANEAITGMVASGAQVILAQCDADNIGGHPIAPIVRVGYDPALQDALADDMDGMIQDRSPAGWVDWILEVASGELTMAEKSGTATFAIQRIGPTL